MFLRIRMIHRYLMSLVSISKRMILGLNIFMKTSPLLDNIFSGLKYFMRIILLGLTYLILMLKYLHSRIKSWSRHQEYHGKLKELWKRWHNHIRTKSWTQRHKIKTQHIMIKYNHLRADHNQNSKDHQLNKNNLKNPHKVSI